MRPQGSQGRFLLAFARLTQPPRTKLHWASEALPDNVSWLQHALRGGGLRDTPDLGRHSELARHLRGFTAVNLMYFVFLAIYSI